MLRQYVHGQVLGWSYVVTLNIQWCVKQCWQIAWESRHARFPTKKKMKRAAPIFAPNSQAQRLARTRSLMFLDLRLYRETRGGQWDTEVATGGGDPPLLLLYWLFYYCCTDGLLLKIECTIDKKAVIKFLSIIDNIPVDKLLIGSFG
jgi:hypothetical protein